MKKFFVFMVSLMILALGVVSMNFGTATLATGAESINKICVTGAGEVRYIPDIAIVSVGVETLNESLTSAQSENSEKINMMIDYLKSIGLRDEDIKTKNFYVYQRYDYSQGEKFIGYQVSNYLDFKTKDVDNVGDIISNLMENGANRFSGINFTIENYDEAYKQALDKAFENAKTKASALSDKEFTNAEIVEEANSYISTREVYSSNASSSVMKGEICIKAQIKVVFEY